MTRPLIDEIFSRGVLVGIPVSGGGNQNIHWMFVGSDSKLYICKGKSAYGGGRCVVLNYDGTTVTQLFNLPSVGYNDSTLVWRVGIEFQGNYYFGLGATNDTILKGDVFKWDGATATRVLQTGLNDIYSMCVGDDGLLYMGCGSPVTANATLYSTSDGTTWNIVQTFAAEHVRGLATWKGKLWIGLRDGTNNQSYLWSYDYTTFNNCGKPFGLGSQVKTLVPAGDKLYIAGVSAYIYSITDYISSSPAFTLEFDGTSEGEIYPGEYVPETAAVYFPTNKTGGYPGRIIKCFINDPSRNSFVHSEYSVLNFHSIRKYGNAIYAGGENRTNMDCCLYSAIINRTVV